MPALLAPRAPVSLRSRRSRYGVESGTPPWEWRHGAACCSSLTGGVMRVVKLLVLAGIVGVGGYVVWAKVRPPEKRACARLAELCEGQRDKIGSDDKDDKDYGDGKDGACEEFFSALKRHAPDAVPRTTSCVSESRSCGQAVGCVSGGAIQLGTGFARDFADGLEQ